jgi:glycosyltransferase involved in cell wall biosynthesis
VNLAFVVQRYGRDIAGGSEAHCRELAERLSARHTLTVLTTCARDYVTWDNAAAAGTTMERGVRVMRFSVSQPRRLKLFADIGDEVFDGHAPPARQEAWFRENGPVTPDLLDHLREHGREYDLVLFWAFRYYPSFFGLPLVADRAVLVPTAENDPAIHLSVLEEFFQRPVGYLFLTPEEEALVSTRAGRPLRPAATIGIGLEPASLPQPRAHIDGLGVPADYVLYLGRVDHNKGCHTLFDYFEEYAAAHESPTLVLAGPAQIQIPAHPRIRALGYVADEVRSALLAHARALIVPSPFESLSIVLLEGWNHAVPALVNARCGVLAGQVSRANGGLSYRSSAEFSEGLRYLMAHTHAREALGRQGLAYVNREYRWPTVLERVEALLAQVREKTANSEASVASPVYEGASPSGTSRVSRNAPSTSL